MAVAASLRQLTDAQRAEAVRGSPPYVGLTCDVIAVEPGADVYSVGAPILGFLPTAEEWAGVGFPVEGPWIPRLYRCPEALRSPGDHPAFVLVRAGHGGIGRSALQDGEDPPWWTLVPPVFVLEKLSGGGHRGTSFRQLGDFNRWWDSCAASRALPWPTGAPLGGNRTGVYSGQLERTRHPAGTFDLVADPYTPAGRMG